MGEHGLNCEAIALVDIDTEAVDHVLELGLCLLPCLPVDLLVLGLILRVR